MKKAVMVCSLLALFIMGCASEEDQQAVGGVFRGGTQGLVASFEPFGVQESGVYTIFDTETFPIEVVLKNKGEEDIPVGGAVVALKGINLNDFLGIVAANLSNPRAVEKVSDSNPDGGEERVDFTPQNDAQYKLNVTGFYTPDIFASVEYLYKTNLAIPQVCFKEDPRDTRVCTVDGAKTFFVSGAPITVTAVEEGSAGRGVVTLRITVQNAGGGKVTAPSGEFDVRTVGGQVVFKMLTEQEKWECRSSGRENEARFLDGTAIIQCRLKQPLPKGDLYTKQVELELSYKYQTLIQEKIQIKESLR